MITNAVYGVEVSNKINFILVTKVTEH